MTKIEATATLQAVYAARQRNRKRKGWGPLRREEVSHLLAAGARWEDRKR